MLGDFIEDVWSIASPHEPFFRGRSDPAIVRSLPAETFPFCASFDGRLRVGSTGKIYQSKGYAARLPRRGGRGACGAAPARNIGERNSALAARLGLRWDGRYGCPFSGHRAHFGEHAGLSKPSRRLQAGKNGSRLLEEKFGDLVQIIGPQYLE